MSTLAHRGFRLHVHISTLFLVLVLAACSALAYLGYRQSVELAENASEELFRRTSRSIASEIETVMGRPEAIVSLLAHQRVINAETLEQRMDSLRFFREAFDVSEELTLLYAGYDDGDFFMLRRIRDAADRAALKAPAGTHWIVQSIEREADGRMRGRFIFLDADLVTIGAEDRPEYAAGYDPRLRGWYRQAFDAAEVVRTEPYVFFTTGELGSTVAHRADNGKAVVAADIRLATFSTALGRYKITPRTEVVLFDSRGQLIAYEKADKVSVRSKGPDARVERTRLDAIGVPALAALAEQWWKSGDGRFAFAVDGESWRGTVAQIELATGAPVYLGIAIPYEELVAAARSIRDRSLLTTLIALLVILPITLFIARRIARPLARLAGEAEAVRNFRFEERPPVASRVTEVVELGSVMGGMKQTIKRFLDVSQAVAAEDDFERLLPRLLKETVAAVGARAGVLYLAGRGGVLTAGAVEVGGKVQPRAQAASLDPDQAPALLRDAINGGASAAGPIEGPEADRAGLAALGMAAASGPTHGIAVPLFSRKQGLLGALLLATERPADAALVSFVNALSGMAAVSLETQERTKALTVAQGKLDGLVHNGIEMSREHDREKLLRTILFGGKNLLHCDAGTLYLRTEQSALKFALRTMEGELPSFEIPLKDKATGAPNDRFVSVYVANNNRSVVIDDVYSETRFDLSGTRRFAEESGYRTVSMLTVPMSPREGVVIGVLQFMNALDPDTGKVIPFAPELTRFVEALAAQGAVALENHNLLEAQKALMDSMIKLVAGAIDAKSPYTGGHCERVPELAIMLADEATKVTEGPLAEFRFKSEDERREFRIGAWLHDCGKVTTPEYVVDKATKLETIYNRIHEVRTRFEVLLRDAEIDCHKAILVGENEAAARQRLAARRAQLLDDFAFVAECNVGGEFMAPERIERMKRIGAQTWVRHFDDRIGLSHEELLRCERTLPAALPATETLLADKPHHVVPRGPAQSLDPKYGFKVKVPENLYNFGEVYNLCIGRGTLTEEERYKINEHIIQTIIMLDHMPFPKELRRVPEYAGTHHETLVGTGYPRRLTQDDLSVPARIMCIADIFEALTASDRPYKKGKTLSESVKILSFFKKDRHIDAELFDLFLRSGVYRRYAERYLKPEQIDDVDIAQYVKA